MDLFNRKKVKELERELKIVREESERDRGELKYYKERYTNEINISNTFAKENSKLIDWVFKILKEFGTMETREKHISIPIYRREPIMYNSDPFIRKEREIIEIPSITIYKEY